MPEVFDCSLALCEVGKQIGEVDARAKVILVQLQALLVVLKAFLVLLLELVSLAKVEESARLGPLFLILDLEDKRLLQHLDCLFALLFLHFDDFA